MFEIVAIITAITTGLSLIITSICWNMRRSRCLHLDIKCLCVKCKMERAIMSIDEQVVDTLTNATIRNPEEDDDNGKRSRAHSNGSRRTSLVI